MLILVANLGSTSFKYKLFDMPAERVLAVGAADRLGQGKSNWSVDAGGRSRSGVDDLDDHAAAIALHLKLLVEMGAIASMDAVEAIGFKAVHGGQISGAVRVDDHVLATMEQFNDVAPQHNPPYIAAMRAFMRTLPKVPQVAAFETAFHQTIPLARQVYGVPHQWVTDLGIRRYGFHGASHRYIATRMAQLVPGARRVISCHLGGSSSICAIRDGKSQANSFGMTAQSGTFHASRVGDFDTFALLKLLKSGMDLDAVWRTLGKESGLLGLSGVSPDMREVEKAADAGNAQARLAIDAFVDTCRQYVGAHLAVLNGTDAVVFTGGIGQHGKAIRAAICRDMDYAGLDLDLARNESARGGEETRIDTGSGAQIWILPTNEELVVARQTLDVLKNHEKQG
jgi:acetate kinase